MHRSENEPHTLLDEPWTGRWEQLRDGMAKSLRALIVDLGLNHVVLSMGPRYEEEVSPDDLPTNDLLWSMRRDLEERGQVIVTLFHDPRRTTVTPENIDLIEQVFAGVANGDDGPRLTILRFSTAMLRLTTQIATQIARTPR